MEAIVTAATFALYVAFGESSLPAHAFGILGPIVILKCVKDLDLRVKLFALAILAWNVIDLLMKRFASWSPIKNDPKPQTCTYTVSISKEDEIEEKVYRPSSPGQESTMSNSSQQLTDESIHLMDSTSAPQNTDVPPVM